MTTRRNEPWIVAPASVASSDAATLLRDYCVEISDRSRQLHFGRRSTPAGIEQGLVGSPNDDLVPSAGVFLLGS
jgi:hypothetical protein